MLPSVATWSLRSLAFFKISEPASSQSVQNRCDVPEFDKPEIGRDAFPPYNHRGTVVLASAWLAFYAIAAIHHFIASGN
jgi:hypothetical protein